MRLILWSALVTSAAAFVASPVSLPKRSLAALHASEIPTSDSSELLGLPARPGRSLKIAIAGGGVGGLTAALCMLKKGFDVTVYEKTGQFARFGGE
jgi:pyruvate/2-oxoglutarate dehydrogenase complex dihydrolipoamide dehydrogenase (E3) component